MHDSIDGTDPTIQPKRSLQSLNTALDIFEAVANSDAPVTITAAAARFGLNKGAVHTILTNLEARGYVQRAPGSLAFNIGLRVWELGLKANKYLNLQGLVHDDLAELARISGETCQLTTYAAPGEILFLHRIESVHAVKASVPVGDRAPATTTSSGLLLLSHQSPAEVDQVLSRPLPRMTPFSITDPKQLKRELGVIKRKGYSIHQSLHYLDTVMAAVPVIDSEGGISYAVSLYGPDYRFTPDRASDLLPDLHRIARSIAKKLETGAFAKPRAAKAS